ncbi:FtsX-like permease family-domain-containing protein [Powellomyces hirtus]|nr:FtsX-like permease family-domain-containing protein [Powellomyces hirtus]
MAMDLEWENNLGLGVTWPYRDLGDGEISVTASLLRKIKVQPNSGQQLTLTISLGDVLKTLTTPISNSTMNGGEISEATTTTNPLSTAIPPGGLFIPNNTLALLPPGQQAAVTTAFPTDGNGNLNISSDAAWTFITETLTNFTQEFRVVDAIDSVHGKYPKAIGNVAIMGVEAAQRMVNNFVAGSGVGAGDASGQATSALLGAIAVQNSPFLQNFTLNIKEYATTIVAIMKDRQFVYAQPPDTRRSQIVRFSNQVATYVGLDQPVDYTAVLLTALDATQFMQIFLGEVLVTVIVVLLALAVLLIFSLLLADVEEKTFEYGMLRSLGMRQPALVNLLFFQALWFSVPAISFGLLVSYVAFVPISYFLSQFAGVELDASMTAGAMSLGMCAGVLLPLFGTIMSTRKALGKTLRDALDVFRVSLNETFVRIDRLEKLGLSTTELIIAFVLIGMGFLVYYIVPLSFVFQDLKLFFRIMTIILLAMLLGAILMGGVFQHWLEITIAHSIVQGVDRPLVHLVTKNLAAHIRRNSKTASIFTLCLAYLVFASTMFGLQANSLREIVEWNQGADILVTAPSWTNPLPEQRLRRFLTDIQSSNQDGQYLVSGFTFVTFNLKSFGAVNTGTLNTLASPFWDRNVAIYGLEPNFLRATFQRYFMTESVDDEIPGMSCLDDDCSPPDVVAALSYPMDPMKYADIPPELEAMIPPNIGTGPTDRYRERFDANQTHLYHNALPILIAQGMRKTLRAEVDTFMQLYIGFSRTGADSNAFSRLYLCKPVAILTKLPSFPAIGTSNGPVLMSMASYAQILADIERVGSIDSGYNASSLPLQKLLITTSKNATDRQLAALANDLTAVLADDDMAVSILRDQVQSTIESSTYITYLFYVVAVVGLIFCFFVLWLSFTANIRENSWEFGVLRAIGFSVASVQRVYVYEAICIIAACVILGTLIGILVALAVAMQFNLFTQLPFTFLFPTGLYIAVVILSFVVSIAGSYLPSKPYALERIATVLKGR